MTKTKKETKAPDQQSLFGEQDHVFNVLHTKLTDIRDEMEKCNDVIIKKEDALKLLKKDLKETQKAIDIVAKQRDKVKPKAPASQPVKKKDSPF